MHSDSDDLFVVTDFIAAIACILILIRFNHFHYVLVLVSIHLSVDITSSNPSDP